MSPVKRFGLYAGLTGMTHSWHAERLAKITDLRFELTLNVICVTYAVKKYPCIHGYFVARFPYFNGTGSVYVCIHPLIDGIMNFHYSVDLRIQTFLYGTGSVKI